MSENWKTIEDYPNYQVSNLGNVKSLKYHRENKEKQLSLIKDKDGYLSVKLCKNGKIKKFLVHRLVAIHFLPNPQNLPQINHINEVKTDNRVENLEWCTNEYNINYGTRNSRMAKTQSRLILQFSKQNEYIKSWNSIKDAVETLNISKSQIIYCCQNKENYKTAGGFKWKYADEYERIPFNIFDLEIYRKKVA